MSQASKPFSAGLVWLRRDLRSHDHAALCQALRQCRRVWCAFVFDTDILQPLLERGLQADRRVEFIHESLIDLDEQLRALGRSNGVEGVGLLVRHGRACQQIERLVAELGVQAVFANHDDEPAALERDARVRGLLAHAGVLLHTFKDHLVLERRELLNQSGQPFTVFTPYKKLWLQAVTQRPELLQAHPVERYADALAPVPAALNQGLPALADIGFKPSNLRALKVRTGSRGALALLEDFAARIEHYAQARDFPALKGPSYLSVHLRFGTISIRQAARLAWDGQRQGVEGAATWLSELIWRDFYHQILANFPHVAKRAFRPEYDQIQWERGSAAVALFEAWCEGQTGYPLVDAGMLQLKQTGYLHNRLRMVTASFLCKDLGLDWRWGERYFAEQLIDYDLASNNGGWQWCASSGCDAQPYFRIFNPVLQSERFDPGGKFIKRYLPVLNGLGEKQVHQPWAENRQLLAAAGIRLGHDYPHPLVDHSQARAKTLERYAVVKNKR